MPRNKWVGGVKNLGIAGRGMGGKGGVRNGADIGIVMFKMNRKIRKNI